MWRNYVICVLIGLLLVSTGSNVWLTRQMLDRAATTARLKAQLATLDSRPTAAPTTTPASAPWGVPAPTVSAQTPDRAVLQSIMDDVTALRGLTPRRAVPMRLLDQADLQRFLVDRFNADYLPIERETDQKLLAALGLIDPNESVAQTLLAVLQEQVVGAYNQDDKVMYLVADKPRFGPDEKDTFAHEYTHALQDQYFDLTVLAPKHPVNDDRALAISALAEGDAVLMQRLWAQQKLTPSELAELGRGGADSRLFGAPVFLREQLLFPYTDGFNFVRQIYQTQGGYPAVDEVFRKPPVSTAQILHPEKYRTRVEPVEVSLGNLAANLGPSWRTINSNVFGELDFRLIMQQLIDRTRAVRAASGWAGDRWVLLEQDGKTALVSKSIWDSDASARMFFETFGQGLKGRFVGADEEEWSATRQALIAQTGAVEMRRDGSTVLTIIAPDRAAAQTLLAAT